MRPLFVMAYLLLAVAAGFFLVLFAAELKAGTPQHTHTRIRVTQGCVKLQCAKVGDSGTYEVKGRVVSVSEPQPGVICIQTQSSRQVSQVCEPK